MTWAFDSEVDTEELNLHLAQLQQHGLLGIAEEDGRATAYLPSRVELPLPGRWREVPDADWNEVWRERIAPVTVGRITVTPPWHDATPQAQYGSIVLVIEPAQAFGTGHHETTAACLDALQRLELHGRTVLDVGTGTGVLGMAALALGAARAVAVDTDSVAVEAARREAARNGLPLEVREGSADAVAGRFDIVVANLTTDVLCELAPQLAARLEHAGVLLASGVANERAGEAVACLAAAGLAAAASPGREWSLVIGGHDHPAGGAGLKAPDRSPRP